MNAAEVRGAVATVIEAAAVARVSGRDRLRYLDHDGREQLNLPERTFILSIQAPPQRLDYMACVANRLELEALVFYSSAPGVLDRMNADAQAIVSKLFTAHEADPDIWEADALPLTPSELDGTLFMPISVIVRYRSS